MNQYNPTVVFPPGDTLAEILEERCMSQADLAGRSGLTTKHINEIIKGKAKITPDTATAFENIFQIPVGFWLELEKNYQEFLAREKEQYELQAQINWVKCFPINDMVKFGWLSDTKDKALRVKELLQFFGVASESNWDNIWSKQLVMYRTSHKLKPELHATTAWLRQGEILSRSISCKDFDKQKLRELLPEIRKIASELPPDFGEKIQQLCAEAGVALVFIPPIKGVRAYGATHWSGGKPIIQCSLRGKFEDLFWFTLFHEIGHVILHGKTELFLETGKNEDEGFDDRKEEEADNFASEQLIPSAKYRQFLKQSTLSKKAVIEFAQAVSLPAGIILGRLQHDKYLRWDQFNELKRKIDFA